MSLVGRGGIILISETWILRSLNYIYTWNLVGRSMGRWRSSRPWSDGTVRRTVRLLGCVEAVPVLDAESVDFLHNWCDLKILSEDHIRHVPWCIGYHVQDFRSEAFQYFDVGDGSWAPELYSIGPDGYGDDTKGLQFVAYRQFGLATQQPVHFGKQGLSPNILFSAWAGTT
jgi:hypothetical protein